ncbi:hypothetical protein AK812_SmicGene21155 [Symbiodinium microadriaticum]|uniref:Chlorophyll a-b binding protein, chloroplastic n=1 Tax=Symbiodinium microadriaticum TaxID=2951 RepID=A0A1Q9DN54_SYMMI|nr:hypothetical protein AK812_SmicGene21155 [Symbiodinium microadriaticum]
MEGKGFDAAPDALQAIYVAPANATGVLLFLAGYIETWLETGSPRITMLDMFEGDGASRAPGDLDFGKRFLPQDKAAADDLALKELTNGRLAMLAFSGAGGDGGDGGVVMAVVVLVVVIVIVAGYQDLRRIAAGSVRKTTS